MLFIKSSLKATGLTTSFFFIIANTTRDLLIMHACDTFCDQLILLHMLFQSAVITLLYFTVINIRLVFMKYVSIQIFKTIMHVDSYTETELYMFYSLCYNYYNVKLHVKSSVVRS